MIYKTRKEEEDRILNSILLKNIKILPDGKYKVFYECCLGYKLVDLEQTLPSKKHLKTWLKNNKINIRKYPEILNNLKKECIA
jgi:hypothetical protein